MEFRRKCRTYDDRRNDINVLMATLAPIPPKVVVPQEAITHTFDNLDQPALLKIFEYIASVDFYKDEDFPMMWRRRKPLTGREAVPKKRYLKKQHKKLVPMNERNKKFWVLKRLYSLTGVCKRWRDLIKGHEKSFRKPTVGVKIMGRPDAVFDDRVHLYIYGGKGNKKPASCVAIEEIREALYPSELVVHMELYNLHLDMPVFDMLMSLNLTQLEEFRFYDILSIDLDGQEKTLMPQLVEHLKSAMDISFVSAEVDPSTWFANEDGSDNVNSVVEGELEKVDSSYTDQELKRQYRSIFRRKEVRANANRRRTSFGIGHDIGHIDIGFGGLLADLFDGDDDDDGFGFGFDFPDDDADESDHSIDFEDPNDDMEDFYDEDDAF